MKLWLLRPRPDVLTREAHPWEPAFEKAFGLVIRGDDEAAARALAQGQAGNEGVASTGSSDSTKTSSRTTSGLTLRGRIAASSSLMASPASFSSTAGRHDCLEVANRDVLGVCKRAAHDLFEIARLRSRTGLTRRIRSEWRPTVRAGEPECSA